MKFYLVDCRPDPRDFKYPFRLQYVEVGDAYLDQVSVGNSLDVAHSPIARALPPSTSASIAFQVSVYRLERSRSMTGWLRCVNDNSFTSGWNRTESPFHCHPVDAT